MGASEGSLVGRLLNDALLGACVGAKEGLPDCCFVGDEEGFKELVIAGISVGDIVGDVVSEMFEGAFECCDVEKVGLLDENIKDGALDECSVGDTEGANDVIIEDIMLGNAVGEEEEIADGSLVNVFEGNPEGSKVGLFDEGNKDGTLGGCSVDEDGDEVLGDRVGLKVIKAEEGLYEALLEG